MRQRDEFNGTGALAVDHEVRETPERHSARDPSDSRAMYDAADRRLLRNQGNGRLQLVPEFTAKALTLILVPDNRCPNLFLGLSVRANRLHCRKISSSIRRRTSFQSDVTACPASKAAHLR